MLKRAKPVFRVTSKTDHVGEGSTFVAIKGYRLDGTDYIPLAIERGAKKIIAEKTNLKAYRYATSYPAIPFTFVENIRKELALQAAAAYHYPSSNLKLIAITGTKGKTTTTFLINHILRFAGYKTALCGSVVNLINDKEEESIHATMESDALQDFLFRAARHNVSHVIVEVSSHALALYRVYGLSFIGVGFTNCHPEHLDFHGTFENYFNTKKKLFDQLAPGGVVCINRGNDAGDSLYNYFLEKEKKFFLLSSDFFVPLVFPSLFLDADFMKENVALAASLCVGLGVSKNIIEESMLTFKGVAGRLQCHRLKNGALGIVDHAHEPLSFEKILSFLRNKTSHLIVVFGCGGERTYKRPHLGAIAAKYADVIILTADNPRFDNLKDIMQDIIQGIPAESREKVIIHYEREEALRHAVMLSRKNSYIALLGRGHEKYQLVKNERFYWSDYEAIQGY